MIRVDDYIRSERAYRSAEIPRGEKMDHNKRDHPHNAYNNRNDQYPSRAPHRGDRRRGNHREELKPRKNEHYAPYGPARKNNNYRTNYHRNDVIRKDTKPIDLNSLTKAPKEIVATEHQLRLPPPPPLKGRPSKENLDRYCDYHGEKGHLTNDCYNLKEQLRKALETGKLDHLVKDVRQREGSLIWSDAMNPTGNAKPWTRRRTG